MRSADPYIVSGREGRRIILVILVCLFTVVVNGQAGNIRISGKFLNTPATVFLEETAKRYNIEFFFDEKDLADITVTAEFVAEPLERCLSSVFREKQVRVCFTGSNRVILYRGDLVAPLFPETGLNYVPEEEFSEERKLSRDALRQLPYRIMNIGAPGRNSSKTAILSGYLRNFETGQPIPGGNIFVSKTQKGASSDKDGFFHITLPAGNQIVNFSCVGMEPTTRNINLYSDGKLDVELELKMNMLDDAVIVGQGEGNVGKMHAGMEKISVISMKSIPSLLGEADVMKSVLALPGVQTVGEGTSGFNIRGGSTDQNLILIDRATLYYPSHFFGNFSAINSEIIGSATLYKGSIPVNYGGRISSVFDIKTIEGNSKKLKGSAGISPIYARFNADGPLFSEKSTYVVSGRTTYSDWILDKVNVPALQNSSAGFYDIQAKLDIFLNERNRLIMNFYKSTDRFSLHSDTAYNYNNTIGSVSLRHTYTPALVSSSSLICSMFGYRISDTGSPERSFELTHNLTSLSLVNDFEYTAVQGAKFIFGSEFILYSVNPGERTPAGGSNLAPVFSDNERAVEYGIYAGSELSISKRLKAEAGIRLSGLLSLDDGKRYVYADGLPYSVDNITDTVSLSRNTIQKSYMTPEWRVSLNYSAGRYSSVKFSYNRTAQYIHMVSNTTAVSPTDTWKLSDVYVTPEKGHQVSAGFFKSFRRLQVEASAEVFYKSIENIKQFKAGGKLLLNDHIETEIVNGRGKSYGLELSLEKEKGRLYGRLDYTYSRTFIRTVSGFSDDLINDGKYFPANYDKPHNFNLLATLKASRRLVFSSGIYYSTGRPVTYPVSKYMLGDQVFLQYSEYNKYRLSDYFRTDLSVTLNGSLRKNKMFRKSLTFSLYNVTARRNVYSVYYRSEGGSFNAYQLSVFGTVIPTLTYNIDF